jgi:phosphotriesterase-related protein
MATIQSATGPIETADMGFTLMHEHVLIFWNAIRQQYPERFDRAALMAKSVERLKAAKAAGVKTMVDLTPIDLGRDVEFIRDAAAASGMQIIAPTGFYYSRPWAFVGHPDSEMTDLMVADITRGVSTTGVRAGVIKCATEPEMDALNERVLRASARAQRETGVPICTHTAAHNRVGLDQQRVFKEEGVDLGRTVIGHSDDSDDIHYLDQLIQNGSYCGMDRIGIPRPRSSDERADMVAKLVERGYADRITLSHDCSCHLDMIAPQLMEQWGTTWRFTHIPNDIVPMLRARGVSDAAIRAMTVENPARLFAG